MEIERAKEIVAAVNARAMITMGIEVAIGSLKGVTLGEMLEAKAAVLAMNAATKDLQAEHGGTRSIHMVPDDRLIAAVYVLGHFHPSNEPILCLPRQTFNGTHVAVACVVLNSDPDADEDEED